jgi:hypothetical protein
MKLLAVILVVCASAVDGCAERNVPPGDEPLPALVEAAPSPVVSGTLDEQTVSAAATVEGVDQKTRHVTLKRADGTKFEIAAGPEVRNLAQLKKGDRVRVEYRQSVAYEVKRSRGATPAVSATSGVSRAAPGEKPGGTVTDAVTVRMTITAIDKGASEATLLGPHGNVTVVKARDPSKLDAVQVGDVVDVTYTEALAVSVDKAGKR